MAAKVFWITGPWQGRLGIVPLPRGADWLDDETRAWREAGINVVVSLLEPDEAEELALLANRSLLQPAGWTSAPFLYPIEACRALARQWRSLQTKSSMRCTRGRALRFTAARA